VFTPQVPLLRLVFSSQPASVLGLGNALVDLICPGVDDSVLESAGLTRGSMSLIDGSAAADLLRQVPASGVASGGSVANTLAALSALAVPTEFVGRVADDELGQAFRRDLAEAGVAFGVPAAAPPPATGRCQVLVSADGERTMATYLGQSAELGLADCPDLGEADIIYLEAYLFDMPAGLAILDAVLAMAEVNHPFLVLNLSDPGAVHRHREFLRSRLPSFALVIGNTSEFAAVMGSAAGFDLDEMTEELAATRPFMSVVTAGAAGARIVLPAGSLWPGGAISEMAQIVHVPARSGPMVDSTGAGDMFAAGVLAGVATGRDPGLCGELGAALASEVISHLGGRPAVSPRTTLSHLLGFR
jgi:sugar/nucleoside kinase (ribokinase family)